MLTCQWTQSSCSAPTVKNTSYCEQHCVLVYQQGTALSKRPRDRRRASQQQYLADLFNQCVLELEHEGVL